MIAEGSAVRIDCHAQLKVRAMLDDTEEFYQA
jgi:hypothetical protein